MQPAKPPAAGSVTPRRTADGAHPTAGAAAPFEAILISLGLFLVLAIPAALVLPFPSLIDELAHLSYARALALHPQLFPDLSTFHQLKADLSDWSDELNYLNHPSLYYLLMAPLSGLGLGGVPILRLINVGIVTCGLALVLVAGCRLFATRQQKLTFALVSVAFPKTAGIAGMINNDNLAVLAGGLIFFGLVEDVAIVAALGLALAGWTKLTALVALGAVVGVSRLFAIWRGAPLVSQTHIILVDGAIVGAIPYVVNLIRTGHVLHWNESFVSVPDAARVMLSVPDYLYVFLVQFAQRWPVNEATLADTALLPVSLLVALLGLAGFGAGVARRSLPPGQQQLALAYLAAFAITMLVHLGFGWQFYKAFGNLTTPEPRYYAILWPGLAVAIACAINAIPASWPQRLAGSLRCACLLFILWPTLLGALLLQIFLPTD